MAKKRYFVWSPLRKLMASTGAKIVSKDAISLLTEYLSGVTLVSTKDQKKFIDKMSKKINL